MRSLLFVVALFLSACSSAPQSASGSGVVLLVVGDSLSAGYGISNPETNGWVGLMETQMRAEGFLTPSQYIVNASVSGDTTQGGLARLPDLLDTHSPSTVVIELGANDALRRQSMTTMGDNLRQMVQMSQQAGANVVLVGIDLPGLMQMIGGGQLDNTIDQVAAETQSWIVDYPLADLTNDRHMQDDRLHPTASGQSFIRDTLTPVIKEAMAAP